MVAAADEGYNDIVQELLKHGASVNVQDRVSQRPCMLPHLCEVLHSLLFLLLVDTCTCKYIVYVTGSAKTDHLVPAIEIEIAQ